MRLARQSDGIESVDDQPVLHLEPGVAFGVAVRAMHQEGKVKRCKDSKFEALNAVEGGRGERNGREEGERERGGVTPWCMPRRWARPQTPSASARPRGIETSFSTSLLKRDGYGMASPESRCD